MTSTLRASWKKSRAFSYCRVANKQQPLLTNAGGGSGGGGGSSSSSGVCVRM